MIVELSAKDVEALQSALERAGDDLSYARSFTGNYEAEDQPGIDAELEHWRLLSKRLGEPQSNVVVEVANRIFSALDDNAGRFSCGEAEAIVRLYNAIDQGEVGDTFLRTHAMHDEPGDEHYSRS